MKEAGNTPSFCAVESPLECHFDIRAIIPDPNGSSVTRARTPTEVPVLIEMEESQRQTQDVCVIHNWLHYCPEVAIRLCNIAHIFMQRLSNTFCNLSFVLFWVWGQRVASRFRSSTHVSGPTRKPAKVGCFTSCAKFALEVSVSPRYQASHADRSFPRSGCSRTQGQGAWSCGEFEMPYTRSATTVISFARGSGHAPGSSRIRWY